MDGPPGHREVEVCLSCQIGRLSSLSVPGVNETGRGVSSKARLRFRVRAAPPKGCGQARGGKGLGAPSRPSWPSPGGAPALVGCASAVGRGLLVPLPASTGPPCPAVQTEPVPGTWDEHGLCTSTAVLHPPALRHTRLPRPPCGPGSATRWPWELGFLTCLGRGGGGDSGAEGGAASAERPADTGPGAQQQRGRALHVPAPRLSQPVWPPQTPVVRPPSPASAHAVR